MMKKKKKKIVEILTVSRADRRILSNVPDPENIRVQVDRRGVKEDVQNGDQEDPEYIKRHNSYNKPFIYRRRDTICPNSVNS